MKIPSSELFKVIEKSCPMVSSPCGGQSTIWHYTSAEGFKSIMEEGEVHFTHNAFLNDSSERTHIFDIADRVLNSLSEDTDKKEFISCLQKLLQKKRDDPDSVDFIEDEEMQIFIFSCSLDKDSLPLWNHYSKNPAKAGFSIGLDIEEVMKLQFENPVFQNAGYSLYPVMYDDSEKAALVENICNSGYEVWNSQDKKDGIIRETYSAIRVAGAFLKHEAFKSEHEARYIIYIKNKDLSTIKDIIKFKNVYGIFTPYIPVPFITYTTLKNVVISPTLKPKQAKSYADLFLRMNGYKVVSETSKVPLRF